MNRPARNRRIFAAIMALAMVAMAPARALTQGDDLQGAASAPPPALQEAVPAARPGTFWAPGHWEWQANHYVWLNGQLQAERPGYRYCPPRWVARNGRWHYEPERWEALRPDYRAREGRTDREQDATYYRGDHDLTGGALPPRFNHSQRGLHHH